MKINNITIFSIITFLIIQLFLIRPDLNKSKGVTNHLLKASKNYIKSVDIMGEKRVVIIGNGPIYNEKGEAVPFQNKQIVTPLSKRLKEENYTVITLGLECLHQRCIEDYKNLGMAAVALKPEAIVFHTISTGTNTDILGKIFKASNIPLYVYGRELPIDYNLYVGPDNYKLGTNLAKALAPNISPRDRILYVETSRLINGDINDNGYLRVEAAKNVFNSLGTEEVATLFTSWSESKTQDQVRFILEKDSNVDLIVTPSGETARGAVTAIEELRLENRVKVVSLDFSPITAQLLLNDSIQAIVSQEFHKQSKSLGDAIINQIKNKITFAEGSKKRFASSIITKDNLNTFKDSEGNYKY